MKIRTYPDQWTDRTMTTLRAGRLEACERDLEGLGRSGLFEEGTTDLDAERLFDISWMKGEEKIPRLHTVEEMRAQVLGQFAQEFALLSPEEHDLVLKMSVIGGEFPLYDWNDLIPARSLIRRLSGVRLTPWARTCSISVHRFSRSRATPLPRMFRTPGRKIPLGSRCRANLPYSLTTVCPALPPP